MYGTCICMCGTRAMEYLRREEDNFAESIPFFQIFTNLGARTQVTRPVSQTPLPAELPHWLHLM